MSDPKTNTYDAYFDAGKFRCSKMKTVEIVLKNVWLIIPWGNRVLFWKTRGDKMCILLSSSTKALYYDDDINDERT